MALSDTLRNIAGPLVSKMTTELGSRVTLAHPITTRRADNTPVISWVAYATQKPLAITQLTAARARYVWGSDQTTGLEAFGPLDTNLLPGDAVLVTGGYMAGGQYLVTDAKPDFLSQSMTLLLEKAPTAIVLTTAHSLPPIRTPALFIRADEMTDQITGYAAVGPSYPYRLGNDPTQANINTPSFDRTVTPPVILFGADDYVVWQQTLADQAFFDSILLSPTGFSVVTAIDFVPPQGATNAGILCLSRNGSVFASEVMSVYVATQSHVFILRSQTGGLIRGFTSAAMAAGKRIIVWTYDPTQVNHSDKIKGYTDGALAAMFAVTGSGAFNISPTAGAPFRWGYDNGATGSGGIIQRQFSIGLWKGVLTQQDVTDLTDWYRAQGF